jgi:hypothetical protein
MSRADEKIGVCRLCGSEEKLVRSHVIPRAFFDLEGQADVKLLSNTPGEYPKRAPIGVYDRILCDPCERGFSTADDYAVRVLKQELPSHRRTKQQGRLGAIMVADVNYELLKRFAIGVLWRASVSEHSFYRRVELGPYEDRARDLLVRTDPGELDEFGSWFSFFEMDWTPSIMDPFKERWAGVTAYRFYFGQVLGYIKVDRRPIPPAFRDIALAPGRNLPLVARDFSKSADLRAMGALVRTAVGRDKLGW